MGLTDRLKQLGDKAKDAAAEHKDQINQAVESAGVLADKKTKGKYRDKIFKATQKTEAAVEKLDPDEPESAAGPPPPPGQTPPATGG
jgi:ElaB/YqjD/DUF883 family membrane-anchored ribosome-binding protein